MKKLELNQMESLEGGMDWKNFADGACLASFLFPPIVTVGCVAYGIGRVTKEW